MGNQILEFHSVAPENPADLHMISVTWIVQIFGITEHVCWHHFVRIK